MESLHVASSIINYIITTKEYLSCLGSLWHHVVSSILLQLYYEEEFHFVWVSLKL